MEIEEQTSVREHVGNLLYPASFDVKRPEIPRQHKRWLELFYRGILHDENRAIQIIKEIEESNGRHGSFFDTKNRPKHPPPPPPPRRKKFKRLVRMGDSFVIEFPYDPALVDICRAMPREHRNWDPDKKYWVAWVRDGETLVEPVIGQLEMLVEVHGFHAAIEDLKWLKSLTEAKRKSLEELAESAKKSHATDADIIIPGISGELRPYQKAGVAYALEHKKAFIADEMGLGKTMQAIGIVESAKAYPALFIVPATLRLNWLREITKWLPLRHATLRIEDMKYTVMNALIMSYDTFWRRYEILEEMDWKAIIFDESHFMKNPRTKRFKAAHDLVRVARPDYRLCLTGTPIENKPEEYIPQLQILGQIEEFGGAAEFERKYCTRDWQGRLTNLEELNLKLRSRCYIRRKKADVEKELPELNRAEVVVEIDNREEYEKANADLLTWLKEIKSKEIERDPSWTDAEYQEKLEELHREIEQKLIGAEALARINYLKQLSARGKLTAIFNWIEDFLDSGEKLVAFAYHKEIQKAIYDRFKKSFVWTREGSTQEAIDRFQGDESVNGIVCSQSADKTGHTLTAASNVAHLEFWWNPSVHDQCDGRCHRIGQHNSVTGWYFIAEKTIDEEIWQLIEAKRELVSAATEGADFDEDSSILGDLMKRLLARV